MRKLAKIALFVPVLLISLISTTTAAEMSKLEFDEQAYGFIVKDEGDPGEGVGDRVFFYAILFDPGTLNLRGTKDTECKATKQGSDGKYTLLCNETIDILDSGTIYAEGKIDQARFEWFKLEKLDITGGNGDYAGVSGQENAIQTRFPDQAEIELILLFPSP